MRPQTTTSAAPDAIDARLRKAGLRPTHQRKALLSILSAGNMHFSAAEVHQRLLDSGNKVSLATVYNNLKEFVDAGIIRSIAAHDRQIIFDTNVEPHHHVINRRTGRIFDTDQVDYLVKQSFPLRPDEKILAVEITVSIGPRD